jgi:hypothetical protein
MVINLYFFKDFKSLRNGILDRPPLVATVQALSLLAIYEGMSGGENSIESTWALMGLAVKLAQSVSLFPFIILRESVLWDLLFLRLVCVR